MKFAYGLVLLLVGCAQPPNEQPVPVIPAHVSRPLKAGDSAPKPLVVTSPSQEEETQAKKLYEEGYELLIHKGDKEGATLKFKECLEKYSETRFLKTPVPPSNKTRIEIIKRLLRPITPNAKDVDPKPLVGTSPTQVEEIQAKQLYEEGYVLLIKKRDIPGAVLKFKECLEKYSETGYMKSPVPPSNRTRIEIAKGLLRSIGR